MSLTEQQQQVLAFYVAGPAADLNMVGRFWPRAELVMILEDKIQFATRPFGARIAANARPVAEALAETFIDRGAFSTQAGKFGGSMHQFQPDAYRATLEEMRVADPIILAAKDGGADYWTNLFA
jgi:hypothetical protein